MVHVSNSEIASLGRGTRGSPAPAAGPSASEMKSALKPFFALMLPLAFTLFVPFRWVKLFGGRISTFLISSLTAACAIVAVRMVRWHMDTFWSWYQEKKWLPNQANYAQDGAPVLEGVLDIRLEKFGVLSRETCHVLTPTKPSGKALVYVHGGGFVVANSTVLLHSITLFCRQGFTVYSLDYPHAPENRFPGPLISILRALVWLKAEHGVHETALFGDSAGMLPLAT